MGGDSTAEGIVDIEDLIAGDVADDFASEDRVKDHSLKKRPKKVRKELLSSAEAEATATPKSSAAVEDEDDDCADDIKLDSDISSGVPGRQKIFVKTFGCSHNISDSEFMMGQLGEYGYTLCADAKSADLILVNSCTVKNPSQEAFMTIVNSSKLSKKPIVVAGCVPQGDRNIPGLEDVSVIGISQIDRVVEVVEETLKGNKVRLYGKKTLPSLDLPKIRKNNLIEMYLLTHSLHLIAFNVFDAPPLSIPINTGCLGSCTYCKTKHARGKLGSYQPEAILQRVRSVCEEGVKEIWLTSEDTGAYGRDIGTDISQLLRQIVEILPSDLMLRVGMTNPPYILEHLKNMATILNHPRVFCFLHIPVQAGNNTVLENMNREYTREEFETVCESLTKNVENMTIATDVICGFPGETNEQFEDTMRLTEKLRFPILNISQFYPRPGTAAMKMKKVPSQDVKIRSRRITELFESFKRWDHLQGTTQRVWINDKEEKKGVVSLVGHTKGYAKVMLPFDPTLLGKSVMIKVTKVLAWHVEGDIIERNPVPETVGSGYFDDYVQSNASLTESKVRKILQLQVLEEEELLKEKKVEEKSVESIVEEEDDTNCCGGGDAGSESDNEEEETAEEKTIVEATTTAEVGQTAAIPEQKKSLIKEYGFFVIAIYLILCGVLKSFIQ